jgi:hypothetical protein
MKVLLDENIPHDLRPHLRHHRTFTAAYLGWAGLKNGQLLAAAEKDAFDVMVTGDLSLTYQQNMVGRKIAIVSLSAIGWPIIEPHVAKIIEAVDEATPGSFTRVECGTFVRPKRTPKGSISASLGKVHERLVRIRTFAPLLAVVLDLGNLQIHRLLQTVPALHPCVCVGKPYRH